MVEVGVEPGDRAVAPGQLRLVQAFVNSVNVEFGPDRFDTLEGYARWLSRHGLAATRLVPTESDRRVAVALREALRALLRENNGAEPEPGARQTINRVAAQSPTAFAFDAVGQLVARPLHDDARGVPGLVIAAVHAAMSDGSWPRLKACDEHECTWAFYDRSRNRSSRWCSMAVCGSRAKMRTYRQGRRPAPAGVQG